VPEWNLKEIFPGGMKNHCDLDFNTALR